MLVLVVQFVHAWDFQMPTDSCIHKSHQSPFCILCIGDIPVFPPIFVLLTIMLGVTLRFTVGRKFGQAKFLPRPLSSLVVRVALFAIGWTMVFRSIKWIESFLLLKKTALNFTPVKGIAMEGPYAYTRNPAYCLLFVLIPVVSTIFDSLWIALAMSTNFLYLNYFVVPAEEALLLRTFGEAYEQYTQRVPRWLF